MEWRVWILSKKSQTHCFYEALINVGANNPLIADNAELAAQEYINRVKTGRGGWENDKPTKIKVSPVEVKEQEFEINWPEEPIITPVR